MADIEADWWDMSHGGVTDTSAVVFVDIHDVALAVATSAVLVSGSYQVVVDPMVAFGHRVTDRLDVPMPGSATTVIVPEAALACQWALEALCNRAIAGIITRGRLDELPSLLDGVNAGRVIASDDVLDLACAAPRLSDRQRRILDLVGAGATNAMIAGTLHYSLATIKREIAALLYACQVPTRAALALVSLTGLRPG